MNRVEHVAWIFLWEKNDALPSPEERVLCCAKAYAKAVAIEAVAEDGCVGRPYPYDIAGCENLSLFTIARSARGKPYFPSLPGLHYSLSHSGDLLACAFYTKPVGLDLQMYTDCRRDAIARRFFHPEEYTYLERHNFEDFFPVWAAKESYVKYTGTGITGGFGTFCVVEESGLKNKMEAITSDVTDRVAGDVEFYRRELPEGYSLCLCSVSIARVQIMDLRVQAHRTIRSG